jgi:hypothetical protein
LTPIIVERGILLEKYLKNDLRLFFVSIKGTFSARYVGVQLAAGQSRNGEWENTTGTRSLAIYKYISEDIPIKIY